MKYVYSFVAWPDETWKFERAMYELFRMLNMRIEMDLTEEEFERFRSSLSHHGITLRECSRRPYAEEETVL